MAVFIAAAVTIYFLSIIFSLFAAIQQLRTEKLQILKNKRSPNKFSLFSQCQTKSILTATAKNLSIWIFILLFLLTDLPKEMWSLNLIIHTFLSDHGVYGNNNEAWTVILPILMLYILYEIHFYVFQYLTKPALRKKGFPPLSTINRASVYVILLHFVIKCILSRDIFKVTLFFLALSLGMLLYPLFKYYYIVWMYPVQPMNDPWLYQETFGIAKRNKISVKKILIVKYPHKDAEGVQCLYGILLVDSRLLQWHNDIVFDFSNLIYLNGNYAPTASQKEVRVMITHALARWMNYYYMKIAILLIFQLASIIVAFALSTLMTSELSQLPPLDIGIEDYPEEELAAMFLERRLRSSCMGIYVVVFCFIVPIAYLSNLTYNIYRKKLYIAADSFTRANFLGRQLCQLLEKKSSVKYNEFQGQHWAYNILNPNPDDMIIERIAVLEETMNKFLYF